MGLIGTLPTMTGKLVCLWVNSWLHIKALACVILLNVICFVDNCWKCSGVDFHVCWHHLIMHLFMINHLEQTLKYEYI